MCCVSSQRETVPHHYPDPTPRAGFGGPRHTVLAGFPQPVPRSTEPPALHTPVHTQPLRVSAAPLESANVPREPAAWSSGTTRSAQGPQTSPRHFPTSLSLQWLQRCVCRRLCACVPCVRALLCTHVHVRVFLCVCVSFWMCARVCLHTCLSVWLHVCARACTRVSPCAACVERPSGSWHRDVSALLLGVAVAASSSPCHTCFCPKHDTGPSLPLSPDSPGGCFLREPSLLLSPSPAPLCPSPTPPQEGKVTFMGTSISVPFNNFH